MLEITTKQKNKKKYLECKLHFMAVMYGVENCPQFSRSFNHQSLDELTLNPLSKNGNYSHGPVSF